MSRIGFWLSLVTGATAAVSAAQSVSPTATVHFRVIDEQGRPVAAALITLSAPMDTVHGSAQTNADGEQSIGLPWGQYEYQVRKIGFLPSNGLVAVSQVESPTVTVALARAPALLDTVRSDARMAQQTFAIGGDEIARDHNDEDSYDVLMHLRPRMLGDVMRLCPYVQNLWVNGRRMLVAPWEAVVPLYPADATPDEFPPPVPSARPRTSAVGGRPRRRNPFPMSHSPPNSPLSLIKPQHIVEIRYVDCWTRSVIPGGFGNNALFITLKAGIGFDMRKGSYIADSALARGAGVVP